MAKTSRSTPFGSLLRQWRTNRAMSQLTLSTVAKTTARHVSFLETGRSRPTESMVLRLCEALEIPLRERNRMLGAAGLGPAYADEPFDAPRYERARGAVARLLEAHEPYPAVLIHQDGDVISANAGAVRLFGGDLEGQNMMDWIFSHGDPSEVIANWAEVSRGMLTGMRLEPARAPSDERLQAVLEAGEQAASAASTDPASDHLVMCPWFIVDGETVRTMVVAARFDNALDVTLEELRIELVYPLDDEAQEFFTCAKK
ncbi:MAG: helix-turn-helix domain-containing protein [Acidimicrobiales bacterium]